MKIKKVYLIGAGPGKPDLISVRGLNILKEADVVIYDYLVDRRLLEYAKPDAELICPDESNKNKLLLKKAKEGKKVVRLKNGDLSVFARTSQELEALYKNRINFETVPGITAASAASSLSGIPLTDRRFASSCVFVTGRENTEKKKSLLDWECLSRCGTIIFYMAVMELANVTEKLLKVGMDKNTPAAVIQKASSMTQKILRGTLKNIASEARHNNIKPPAIAIIGKVAKLERKFSWLRKQKRILFTGLSPERYFEEKVYFHLPLIKIEPLGDYRKFDSYLRKIKEFHWVVFASRYGVEYFFKRLKAIGCDSRLLSSANIAAIGSSTKNRLLEYGICADLVPEKESSEGLIKEFAKIDIKGKRIFMPRSDISDKGLAKSFERLGAEVTTGFAYRNIMPKELPELDLDFFDEIIFTSPSTVRNFKKKYSKIPRGIKVNCIGDITLREAKKCRFIA